MDRSSSKASSSSFSSSVPHEMPPQKEATVVVPLKGAIAGSGSSSKEALFGLMGGMLFGLVSPTVGHPFDTVKTKMQVDPLYKQLRLTSVVQKIYATEGMRGFYRGFIPPLIGSIGYRGILFSAYSGTYAFCSQNEYLHHEIPFTGGLRISVLLGASVAAVARATIESPLDFIKLRWQIGSQVGDTTTTGTGNRNASSTSSNNAVANQIRLFAASPVSSIRHLYHGYIPTLLRTLGLLGSFFVLVDYSVRYIPEVINAPLIGPFFKGGVCATTAWIVAFPLETVKSVIQADTTGKYKEMRSGATLHVIRKITNEKGVRGLYRGFGPGASRSFVANGTSMMVYSWFQDNLRQSGAS